MQRRLSWSFLRFLASAASEENCLKQIFPVTSNSNDLTWEMSEEILAHIYDPVFPDYSVNVLDYGAIPNDGKLDTTAIQRELLMRPALGAVVLLLSLRYFSTLVPSP